MNRNRRRRWLLTARLGLFLAAWALLLFRLNDVPPGFQHDQTFTSVDALDVLAGRFPIYFSANFGREPLFMYSVAGVFGLTGGHYVWSLRLTSVLWGMLGLATTLVLARRILSEGAALVAAALMAASFWFLLAARLGLEPIATLPLAMVCLYFLDRGLQGPASLARPRPSLLSFVAAGLAGGIAIYTYLAARVLLLLPPLLLLYEGVVWMRQRRAGRLQDREQTTRLIGLCLTLFLMLVVSAPLLVYLLGHSTTADGRLRELGDAISSAARGDLRPILGNVLDTVRSILWAGSKALPYHYNIPGRPVLQPLLAIFTLVGLIATLLRLRDRREYLLVAALLLGLAPSLLTGADALYMRGIIVLPLLFILAARGLWLFGSLIRRPLSRWRIGGRTGQRSWTAGVAGVLLAGMLLWHAADSATAYLIRWAAAEPTQRIYNADFRAAAQYLDNHPADAQGEVFIGTDRLLDLDSRTYELYGPASTGVNWFSLPESPPLPVRDGALYLIPAVAETPPSLRFVSEGGAGQFVLPGPGGEYELLRGVRVDAEAVQRALDAAGVREADEHVTFGDALRLDGLGYREHDSRSELVTQWTVLAPWPRAARPGYLLPRPKLALSLVDGAGYKWVQADVATSMPVLTWRPGQMLVEQTSFTIPADLPPGDYGVQLVLYDDEGGPLAMRTADGREAAAPPVVARLDIPAGTRGDPAAPLFPVQQTQAGAYLLPLGGWESPELLLEGVPADLHISWQALQPLDTDDLRFHLRATTADGIVVWEQAADPVTPLPERWPTGQTYRLTHRLQPQALKAEKARVSLELCAERASEVLSCAVVGQPVVVRREPIYELPAAPQQTVGARWDEALTLAGYDATRTGQTITVTLYWRTDAPTAVPLKRFVHAVGADGQIVAQSDSFLESGGIPVTYWRPGEVVVDRAAVDIPAGTPVTDLYLGLYDPQTGARVPANSASGEPLPDQRLTIDLPPALP